MEEDERLEVVSADGARFSVRLQPGPTPGPVMLCFPAMGVEARFYRPLLSSLRAAGITAAAVDLRGTGESSVRPRRDVAYGYHEMVSLDWPAITQAVRALFPGRPLILLGHSLGGQINALALAADPDLADGLVLVAACSVYYRSWDLPRRLWILGGTQMANVVAQLVGHFPGRHFRFAGRESRQVIRDWARQARTGRYQVDRSTHDFETLLGRLQKSVLAISIEGDQLAPARAVDHLCAKLARADVSRWHYVPESGQRVDHFGWVKRPEPLVERLKEWLEQRWPVHRNAG